MERVTYDMTTNYLIIYCHAFIPTHSKAISFVVILCESKKELIIRFLPLCSYKWKSFGEMILLFSTFCCITTIEEMVIRQWSWLFSTWNMIRIKCVYVFAHYYLLKEKIVINRNLIGRTKKKLEITAVLSIV